MRRLLRYFSTALILGLTVTLAIVIPVLAASVTLSVARGAVGTIVTVDGSGFTASSSFPLKFDSIVIDTVSSDSVGVLESYDLTVPEKPAGSHTIYVGTTTKTFTIIPKITLGSTSGTAGTTVTISGKGFAADDGSIQISFDSGTPQYLTTSDTNGSFPSTSFTVPAVASGSHTVTATDSASTPNTASSAFTTISNAAISMSKTSGAAGSSITVNGSGFVAGESSIVVTYDGNPIGSSTSANAAGAWGLTFNIPASAGGTHTIDAYGATTKATEVADKTFSVTAGLIISKNNGPPGIQVTVTGAGFAANETGINVTWDSAPIGNPANAGPTGAWTSSITIPTTSAGAHNINAYGTSTTSGGANLSFTVGAGITTSKTSGTAGTTVSVSGAGFAANEKITITFDTTTVSSNTASATGTWTANFSVPASSGGDHNINATGVTTKAAAIFTTLPSVILDTANASTGSTITATGSGFTPGQKSITVTFDDQELTSGISADTSGSWKATFAVPSAASGSHTIKIAGAGGVDLSVDAISFKIKPAVALSPATGTVGSTVSVKGTGFAAGSNITITYDDNSVAKVSADGSGSFSKSIVIPKSLAGDHEVKASDPTNSAVTNFTIDSTAPPVPKPSTPTDGQTIGFMGSITPTFTWAKVTASSAVTYTFQVDSDPEFANPLEKGGLTVNKYTLTNSEALPRGDYYWRVRAVDTASNQSPWSQSQYLKSGLISPVLFTLILILVIAALAAGVYFLLTKVLPRRRAAQMASSPELVIPEIVNAEFKQIEGGKTALPWRLALPPAPQQPKGSKTLSSEDQARLKVIIDFAKALPLPQPDSTTGWLVEMAENVTGNSASPALYNQMLKGEIQVRYEPAWMRHPTFLDLQSLLEGQPIMQDLTTFVDTINNLASSADQVLQDIYRDTTAEVTWDLIANGGWAYISGVYTDGVGWFQGKNLREPSDRDYSVKAESAAGEEPVIIGLYGDQNTAFAGLLVKAHGETEVQQLRALHLKLRRSYRGSDKLKDLVNLITQLDVQRTRLLNAFSQFNRLST
jgi:hypothetical protein